MNIQQNVMKYVCTRNIGNWQKYTVSSETLKNRLLACICFILKMPLDILTFCQGGVDGVFEKVVQYHHHPSCLTDFAKFFARFPNTHIQLVKLKTSVSVMWIVKSKTILHLPWPCTQLHIIHMVVLHSTIHVTLTLLVLSSSIFIALSLSDSQDPYHTYYCLALNNP